MCLVGLFFFTEYTVSFLVSERRFRPTEWKIWKKEKREGVSCLLALLHLSARLRTVAASTETERTGREFGGSAVAVATHCALRLRTKKRGDEGWLQ